MPGDVPGPDDGAGAGGGWAWKLLSRKPVLKTVII
jgi:hypothetical protein